MVRPFCALFCLLILIVASPAQSQQPTFSFDTDIPDVDCGSKRMADPGTPFAATADVTLTTTGAPDPARGAQGWSLSFEIQGVTPTSATIAGTISALETDNPPGLRKALSFELTEITMTTAKLPENDGVVSAVVLALIEDIAAPGKGTQVILKVGVEGSHPESGCTEARLFYEDGLVGGGQPVQNNITWEGRTVLPQLGSCTVMLCAEVAPEVCDDGEDNNGDGLVDCDDPQCAEFLGCQPEVCDDGADNNGDGLTDCDDPQCAKFLGCQPEVCDDGADNNGDGLTDCDDPQCAEFIGCQAEVCDDGEDNNGDGLADCDDPACGDFPGCLDCESAEINVIFQTEVVTGDGGLNQVPELNAGRVTEIEMPSGSTRTVYTGFVLQMAGSGFGLQGWSLSLPVEGVAVTGATTGGTIAALEPAGLRLPLSFELTEITASSAQRPNNDGVVTAVVFGLVETVETISEGTVTGLAIDIEAPEGDFTGSVGCRDGLQGGGQPVENLFTVNGESRMFCACFEASIRPIEGVSFSDFIRGDPNDDGKNNIADAIWIVNELFRDGPPTACADAADANDDGVVDLGDAMFIVDYQFRGGDILPAPFPACGADPTDDTGDDDRANDLACPVGSVDACPPEG